MNWPSGHLLQNGEYTIEKELGTGRFGTTYLAKHKDGTRLVIKTLSESYLNSISSPDKLNKLNNEFIQEAGKLAECKHKHIVKSGRPFLEGDRYCIAMEYIGGVSLAARDEPKVPEAIALQYIKQVGEALIVVHENNLVHRDVQPNNILVRTRHGKSEAVLIDFGLALEFNRDLTAADLAKAKTDYAAEGYTPPELYSRYDGDIGPHTDIYALAATLYDLLTGQPPISATKRKDDGIPLRSPLDLDNSITPNVSQQIMRGLELSPSDRPQSMREWLISLDLIDPSVTPTTSAEPSPDPKPVDWKWIVGTIIALIAALGAAVAGISALIPMLNKPSPSPSPTPTPHSSDNPAQSSATSPESPS
ncbi:MAG: serine/threonine protein kinase [Phormidesmis sp. RL_2_1]|nr:serine/threonine protein kinase [Phormidesmis sp. RL_2_1]